MQEMADFAANHCSAEPSWAAEGLTVLILARMKPYAGLGAPMVAPRSRPPSFGLCGRLEIMSAYENADDYEGFVVRLNDRWRVVAANDGIQWVMQRRSSASDKWSGKYYFRRRDPLIMFAKSYEVGAEPEALAVLEALPEISRGSQAPRGGRTMTARHRTVFGAASSRLEPSKTRAGRAIGLPRQ